VEKKWHVLLLFRKIGEEEEDGGRRCWTVVVVDAPAELNLAAEEDEAAAQLVTRLREALVAASRNNALVRL